VIGDDGCVWGVPTLDMLLYVQVTALEKLLKERTTQLAEARDKVHIHCWPAHAVLQQSSRLVVLDRSRASDCGMGEIIQGHSRTGTVSWNTQHSTVLMR